MKMSNGKLEMIDVRLSFPKVWKAVSFEEGQAPKYEASFLLDPTNPAHKATIKEIKTEANRLCIEKWGPNWSTEDHKDEVKLKGKCFGTAADLDEVYDGYTDAFWVRTSKKAEDGRVLIVDRDFSPLTEEDGKIYAGCYVTATFSMWCQDNKFGKRINGQLRAIKFHRDGDAFSAGEIPDAENEFSRDEADEQSAAADSASNSFLDD